MHFLQGKLNKRLYEGIKGRRIKNTFITLSMCFTKKMKVIHSSKMFITTNNSTWCHNPQDHNQHLHHYKNSVSHWQVIFLHACKTSSHWANKQIVKATKRITRRTISQPLHDPVSNRKSSRWGVAASVFTRLGSLPHRLGTTDHTCQTNTPGLQMQHGLYYIMFD